MTVARQHAEEARDDAARLARKAWYAASGAINQLFALVFAVLAWGALHLTARLAAAEGRVHTAGLQLALAMADSAERVHPTQEARPCATK